MAYNLSECTGHSNNFNLIRLIAATMVLYGHCFPLTGSAPEPLSNFGLNLGHIAVDIFFVTSGFLVTGSLISRKNIIHFFLSRCLRILPALIISLLFCIFIVGICYTELPASIYLSHPRTYSFLFHNINLLSNGLQWDLPGVFVNNPYKIAVNGSLWTLPWEIKMYLILFIIGTLLYIKPSLLNPARIWIPLLALYLISTVLFLSYYYIMPQSISHQLRFLSTFFAGSLCYIFKNHIIISHRLCLLIMATLFYFSHNIQLFFTLYHISISYIVMYLAFFPYKNIHQFNKIGDYSYGLYIYAFPVQQSIVASFNGITPLKMFFLSGSITLLLAIISWHLIEHPTLRLKTKFSWIEKKFRNIQT